MNEINTEHLLSQIRSLGRELHASPQGDVASAPAFGDMLKSSLEAVNEAQQHSAELKAGFVNGTGDATLAEVMIAASKADLSFRTVTEVRNKLITAYQEIMNMPV